MLGRLPAGPKGNAADRTSAVSLRIFMALFPSLSYQQYQNRLAGIFRYLAEKALERRRQRNVCNTSTMFFGKQARGIERLVQRISGSPHSTSSDPVVACSTQQVRRYMGHQGGVVLQRVLLQKHNQFGVLLPVAVGQAAAVAAHHNGELRRVLPFTSEITL